MIELSFSIDNYNSMTILDRLSFVQNAELRLLEIACFRKEYENDSYNGRML